MSVPGSNIALLRRQMGFSQRSFAKAAELDYSTLSRLERGEGGYSDKSIEKIAKLLNVSKGILFAEPGVVEAAALGMREVPIMTSEQLFAWKGHREEVFSDRQKFLHTSFKTVSNHAFALVVPDDSNSPSFRMGDELIFDAGRQPQMGKFVVAQAEASSLIIGKFRARPNLLGQALAFDVVPEDRLYPVLSSQEVTGLLLRGTLAEHRRMYR